MSSTLSIRGATLSLFLVSSGALASERSAVAPRPTPAALATGSAPTSPSATPTTTRTAAAPRGVTTASPADAVGRGPWEKAGCLGCAALIIGAGGTTLLGVAIIASAFPEAVVGCGALCIYAFS